MSQPGRVMQLITELRPAGAERIVFELARGLPADGWQVQVCSLVPATGAVADWLRAAGVTVHSLEMSRKLDWTAPGRLARLLRAERIDVLHSHLFHANLVGRLAARRAGTSVVIGTVHIPERRFRPWHFWLDRWTLSRRDVEVCVSEAVRRFTRDRAGIPARQLRVIPNGVDLARFAAAGDPAYRRRARAALREKMGLSAEALLVLAVGRLEPQKGYLDLVDAWAALCGKRGAETAGAWLVIAGEGSQRSAIARRAAERAVTDRFRLLGHRDDVPELMAASDLFVLSSHYEGFGLVLAEAMASLLPVVVTDVDAAREVLGDSGAGLLTNARVPEALAEAMGRLIEAGPEARAQMGQAGLERVRANYSLPTMLSRYGALYRQQLDEARRGGRLGGGGPLRGGVRA